MIGEVGRARGIDHGVMVPTLAAVVASRDAADILLPAPVGVPEFDALVASLTIEVHPGLPAEIAYEGGDAGGEKEHKADNHEKVPIWRVFTGDGLVFDGFLLAVVWDPDVHRE